VPTVSIIPQTNNLRGTITQTNQGTLPVKYYYSSNGTNKDFEVAFPTFDISGTTARTFYVIADNSAGTVVSSPVSGTPYVFGGALTVNLSSPTSNTIQVSYSQTVQGTSPTTYSYVLNGGPRVTVSSSPFDISGLTATSQYSFYMVASNSAGDLSSNTITQSILGTVPTLSIVPQTNNLRVNFSQTSTGTLPVKYYYSFNGTTRESQVNTPAFDISGTVQRTVYIIADNSAGTVVSQGVTGIPYVVGDTPIVYVENGINKITVNFLQSNLGTAPVTYYYSDASDGSNRVGPVTSPFDISNITTTKTVYVIASNIAGNVISSAATGTPYTIGSAPVITNISSEINSLIIDFSGSTGGNPAPYAYYYSLDGAGYTNANRLTSPITITDLTNKSYTVTLVAKNLAGFSLPSNLVTGTPTYQQTIFNWVRSSPPKEATSNSGGSFAQDRRIFTNVSNSTPTTIEERQIQNKKKYIGGGRRSASDIISSRRVNAAASSLNPTGINFSYNTTK
jgi:hypothetical protein